MSTNKNSLLASLTGDGPDQDLFGDVPIDDDDDTPPFASPAAAATANSGPSFSSNNNPLGALLAPPTGPTNHPMSASVPTIHTNGTAGGSSEPPKSSTTTPSASSFLSKSGLLGMVDSLSSGAFGGGGGGGGGLFDEVDQEEERKAAEEAERKRKQAEEEQRKRQEAEEVAARLKQQQQEEEERKRRQEQMRLQQQQQQQQQAMMYNQSPYQPQQQQQQPPPQPYGYASQQQPPIASGQSAPLYGQAKQPYQQQQQQQQQSAMMQSAVLSPQQLTGPIQNMSLNNSTPNININNQGLQRQNPQMVNNSNQGFYREHPPAHIGVGPVPPSNAYGSNVNNYNYGTQPQYHNQQQQQHVPSLLQQQQQRPNNMLQPSIMAGMHNSSQIGSIGHVKKITLIKPQEVPPLYTDIKVTEPMLIQTQRFILSSAPYWSYQITSTLANNQGTWLVRRRFRHVVALEDRMRQACPGCILPPRPDKHATRALEEASTQQSAEFAMHRAKELEAYLNALARHPMAGHSQVLRLFLGLQDDIGTAWPEVSPNALTRLGAVGAGMSMMVAESSTSLTAGASPAHEWEENAELLSLCSSENLRLGAVSQAVPKLEGAVTLLREQGDAAGALGMELSKMSKVSEDLKVCDILSNGLLRHGRRTKRLALELSAAMDSFLQQYKLVRYEKMAMQDRRHAIQRKSKERGRADARALYLSQQQRQLQAAGQFDQLSHLERSAVYSDEHALDVVTETEEIGRRLQCEIHRVAIDRRIQWNANMKTIASSMKEACSERLAIWESTLEAFQNLQRQMDGGIAVMPPLSPGLAPPHQHLAAA